MIRARFVVFAVAALVACAPANHPTPQDASSRRDAASSGPLLCAARGPEDDVASCSDGCDNDAPAGDGYADCDDFDCCPVRHDCPVGSACGDHASDAGGFERAETGTSTCARGPERSVSSCSDGCSNDDDAYADCDDFDCCAVRGDCPSRSACGRQRDAGACRPGPENDAASCSDGCSNDGDDYVDCSDYDCCGRVACDPSTACGRG